MRRFALLFASVFLSVFLSTGYAASIPLPDDKFPHIRWQRDQNENARCVTTDRAVEMRAFAKFSGSQYILIQVWQLWVDEILVYQRQLQTSQTETLMHVADVLSAGQVYRFELETPHGQSGSKHMTEKLLGMTMTQLRECFNRK